MKRLFLTILFTLSICAVNAQSDTDAKTWYMNGAAYTGRYDANTGKIYMVGGTLEEARSFVLTPQNPEDPFFYDVSGLSASLLPGKCVSVDVIDERPYYIFMDDEYNTTGLMVQIQSVDMLNEYLEYELASLTEAEYVDEKGRAVHITQGSLQLPGEKSYDMTFGKIGLTPVNVMVSNGKCWEFIVTCEGLQLRLVEPAEYGGYRPAQSGKTIRLKRLNGTLGRWPNSSSEPLQLTMLECFETEALRCMREEILTRDGHTHLSKMEMNNVNIIQTEERRRK